MKYLTKNIFHFFIFSIFLSCTFEVKGIDVFRFNNELPSKSIRTIYQDNQGFIWIGTNDWVVCYDGNNLHKLPLPADIGPGLSQRITSIIDDKKNNIWIGTHRGVYRYNKSTRELEHYMPDEKNWDNKSNVVYSLTLSPEGVVFIGTRNGIFEFNDTTHKLNRLSAFAYHKTFNELHKSERIAKKIFFDKMGFLWVGTEGNGLSLLDLKNGSQVHYKNEIKDSTSLAGNFINDIYEDYLGRLWIATNEGLSLFKRESGLFESYKFDNPILAVSDNGKGTLLLATDLGIAQLNTKDKSIDWIRSNPLSIKTLLSNDTYAILKDKSGSIWIGSSGGINKLGEEIDFTHFRNIPNTPNSLSSNIVTFIQSSPAQQSFWIGTGNNGIDKYDVATNQFTHYSTVFLRKLDNGFGTIRCGYLSRGGTLYVGTDGGLFALDTHNGQITPLFWGKNYSEVYTIMETSQGDILFNVLDKGLHRYNPVTRKISMVSLKSGNEHKDIYGNIKGLYEDSRKNLWIIFYMSGVGMLDHKTGELTEYTQENTHKALPDNFVWDITELSNGDIAFATSSGLGIYNYGIKNFTPKNQFNDKIFGSTNSIITDRSKYIWLGTDKGITRISLDGNNILTFSELDGLQGPSFNYQSKAMLGPYLAFGGNNGFNVIDTRKSFDNNYIPKPAISYITFRGEDININKLREKDKIPYLRIKNDSQQYQIHLSAFSYKKEWRNKFRYKILPLDKEWKWLDKDANTFTLPHLPPGEYTLVIKASNSDGKWSEECTVLEIKVVSVWMTSLFSIVVILICLSVIFYFLNKKYPKFWKQLQRGRRKKKKTLLSNQPLVTKSILKQTDAKTQKLIDKLISLMTDEHIYTNKRLNKAQLAAMLKLTELQLAQMLKDYIGKGFTDFVNYYRVEAVKEKLNDPKYKDITLMGIGDECGFNSKTSFYRVFKDLTGVTPAEYLEQIRNDENN